MTVARVVTFDGVSSERMEQMRAEMADQERPDDVPATEIVVLHDPDAEKSVVMLFFDNEEDYARGDAALNAMPAGDTPGQRTSVAGGAGPAAPPTSRVPSVLEPLRLHLGGGVDVDHAELARAGVGEGVRRSGRRDHDLARLGDDHVVAHAERRLAALDDEQLRIGMAVKRRALARRRVDEEHRHGHVMVGADELMRVLAAVEIVDVDHRAHGPNDTAAGYSPSVGPIDDRKSSDVFV